MSQSFPDQFKRFRARVNSVTEAHAILASFYLKFGKLEGRHYLCSETTIEDPRDGGYHARIGLIPWPYKVREDATVDFERLISESGAAEISA